jgi:chaperonin GroES
MIQPLNNRILVKPFPPAHSTLIIPEKYIPPEVEPIEAIVVALGKKNRDRAGREIEWSVKPGDHVFLVDFMGAETFQNLERHLIVKEIDILAIIERA